MYDTNIPAGLILSVSDVFTEVMAIRVMFVDPLSYVMTTRIWGNPLVPVVMDLFQSRGSRTNSNLPDLQPRLGPFPDCIFCSFWREDVLSGTILCSCYTCCHMNTVVSS